MELTSVKGRIEKILRSEGLSASQFADEIGVQRPNVSHILSGRNNPSLEFVQKILHRFKHINSDWLLFGNGEMKKIDTAQSLFSQNQLVNDELSHSVSASDSVKTNNRVSPNLFASNNDSEGDVSVVNSANREISSVDDEKVKSETASNTSIPPSLEFTRSLAPAFSEVKKVKQIVILYDDGTFSIYNQS